MCVVCTCMCLCVCLCVSHVSVTVVQSKGKEETGHAPRSETSKAGTIGLERFLDVSADDAVVQARARRQRALPPSAPTATRSLSSGLPLPPDDAALGVGASAGSLDGSSVGTTGSAGAAVGTDTVPEGGRSQQGVDGCAEHRVTLTLYKAWSAKSPYAWETLPPGVSHDADQLLSFSGQSCRVVLCVVRCVVTSAGRTPSAVRRSWPVGVLPALRRHAERRCHARASVRALGPPASVCGLPEQPRDGGPVLHGHHGAGADPRRLHQLPVPVHPPLLRTHDRATPCVRAWTAAACVCVVLCAVCCVLCAVRSCRFVLVWSPGSRGRPQLCGATAV